MRGTQHWALAIQGLLVKRPRLHVVALKIRKTCEVADDLESLGIASTQRVSTQFQRPLELCPRLGILPQIQVGLPDGVTNRRLYFRLALEFSADRGGSAVQCR